MCRSVAHDANGAAVRKAEGRIAASLDKQVKLGKLAAARREHLLGLLTTTSSIEEMGDVDLVIEAVFEDVAAKHSVLVELEGACRPDMIIASNTSSISLDVLAEVLRRPERLIGMHFFQSGSAHAVGRGHQTTHDACAGRRHRDGLPPGSWGRLRYSSKIGKGSSSNRVLIPYLIEAFWLLQEGASAAVIDDTMLAFGLPDGAIDLEATWWGWTLCFRRIGCCAVLFPGMVRSLRSSVSWLRLVVWARRAGAGVYELPTGRSHAAS